MRRAQTLGLTLTDVRAVLEISDQGRVPCEHVLRIIDRELERVAAQTQRLRELKSDLSRLRSRLVDALKSGAPQPGKCPCFDNDEQQPADWLEEHRHE